MSILFHHYNELTECMKEVEQIEAKVNNKHTRRLTVKKRGEAEQLEQESKAVIHDRHTNVAVPLQEGSKTTTTKRKKKSPIAKKEKPSLDSYCTNMKIG